MIVLHSEPPLNFLLRQTNNVSHFSGLAYVFLSKALEGYVEPERISQRIRPRPRGTTRGTCIAPQAAIENEPLKNFKIIERRDHEAKTNFIDAVLCGDGDGS